MSSITFKGGGYFAIKQSGACGRAKVGVTITCVALTAIAAATFIFFMMHGQIPATWLYVGWGIIGASALVEILVSAGLVHHFAKKTYSTRELDRFELRKALNDHLDVDLLKTILPSDRFLSFEKMSTQGSVRRTAYALVHKDSHGSIILVTFKSHEARLDYLSNGTWKLWSPVPSQQNECYDNACTEDYFSKAHVMEKKKIKRALTKGFITLNIPFASKRYINDELPSSAFALIDYKGGTAKTTYFTTASARSKYIETNLSKKECADRRDLKKEEEVASYIKEKMVDAICTQKGECWLEIVQGEVFLTYFLEGELHFRCFEAQNHATDYVKKWDFEDMKERFEKSDVYPHALVERLTKPLKCGADIWFDCALEEGRLFSKEFIKYSKYESRYQRYPEVAGVAIRDENGDTVVHCYKTEELQKQALQKLLSQGYTNGEDRNNNQRGFVSLASKSGRFTNSGDLVVIFEHENEAHIVTMTKNGPEDEYVRDGKFVDFKKVRVISNQPEKEVPSGEGVFSYEQFLDAWKKMPLTINEESRLTNSLFYSQIQQLKGKDGLKKNEYGLLGQDMLLGNYACFVVRKSDEEKESDFEIKVFKNNDPEAAKYQETLQGFNKRN